MAHYKFDLVQETSTSTGATTMALAGAVTRRRRFGDVLSNADTCYVLIEHASAAEWQVCLATWNTGHSLTLGTVLSSSTGSAVSFSAGTKTISMVAPAAKSIVEDNNGDVSVTRNATAAGAFTSTANGANFVASNAGIPYFRATDGTRFVNIGIDNAGDATYPTFFNASAGFKLLVNGGTLAAIKATAAGAVDIASTLAVGSTITHPNGIIGSTAGVNFRYGIDGNGLYFTQYAAGVAVVTSLELRATSGNAIFASRVGIGATSLTERLTLQENGNAQIGLKNAAGTTIGYIGTISTFGSSGTDALRIRSDAAEPIDVGHSGTVYWQFYTGYFRPLADNTKTLGDGSHRLSEIFCGNAVINTSGLAAKLFVAEASNAEKRAAATIKAKPRRYKWADAVEKKGDVARWHFGYIAEDVRDALAAEGLDPWAYGFLCSDPIIKHETYTVPATRPKMRKVMATESAVEIIDGKPVMARKQVERDEPVGEAVAVVDEAGEPIMQKTGEEPTGEVEPVLDGDGKPMVVRVIVEEDGRPAIAEVPATRAVMRDVMAPLMHFVPEMEEYEEERTREVDTGEVRLGLRYSELEAFLRSAD